MSLWENYDAARRQQRTGRRRALVTLSTALVLIAAATAAWLLFRPEKVPVETADLLVAQPLAAPARENQTAAPAPQTGGARVLTEREDGRILPQSESFGGEHLVRLAANLAGQRPPSFKNAGPAGSPGPQKLELPGDGAPSLLSVGRATLAPTEIIGAAGEWQVRPWWNPGWLPATVDCGEIGTAAIAGHVSWAGRPGPFHRLGTLTAGDQIRCQASSGLWFTYEVTEVVRIDYTETDYYWRPLEENTAELTLFSCTPEISGIVVARARLTREEN